MKRILLGVATALAALTMTGCGYTSNLTTNHNVSQTAVELNRANYRIVGKAEGHASASYVFGIGGLSRQAVRGNAQADMYNNADLTDSQAIINANTSMNVRGVAPFYVIVEYTAQGTIIEFTE